MALISSTQHLFITSAGLLLSSNNPARVGIIIQCLGLDNVFFNFGVMPEFVFNGIYSGIMAIQQEQPFILHFNCPTDKIYARASAEYGVNIIFTETMKKDDNSDC